MVVAAYLPPDVVNQGQKLALMKICDSADDETRLGRPGGRRLRAWVGAGEKRCATIVTELVAKGLVERVEVARAGRAAVYQAFPLGVPPIPSNDELDERHRQADAAPKNPRKARTGTTRAKPSKPAMTHEDVAAREEARQPPADSEQRGPKPAPEGGEGAGFHGWNPENDEARVPPVEPTGFHVGNPLGSTGGTPSFLGPSSVLPFPPTPAAGTAGEPAAPAPGTARGCPKHPTLAANCRGCGTNPRAGREQREQERREAVRSADQAWIEGWRADQEQVRMLAEQRPDAVQAAKEAAFQAVRQRPFRRPDG
jgi:hypothetical protein